MLELAVPTNINIVCYRYRRDGMDNDRLKALNTEILLRLQEEGTAAVSDTTVRGRHCLRVAINNHRTRSDDLQRLVRETIRLGNEIAGTLPSLSRSAGVTEAAAVDRPVSAILDDAQIGGGDRAARSARTGCGGSLRASAGWSAASSAR